MIKKKRNEDLRSRNIIFNLDTVKYQALRFYQLKMTVDVIALEDDADKGIKNLPFAHLPKAIKKIIKPN